MEGIHLGCSFREETPPMANSLIMVGVPCHVVHNFLDNKITVLRSAT